MINFINRRTHISIETSVHRQSLTGWHQECEEDYLPVQLGMFLEYLAIGLKAPHEILRWLHLVHAHNRILTQQRLDRFSRSLACCTIDYLPLLSDGNGNGIGSR